MLHFFAVCPDMFHSTPFTKAVPHTLAEILSTAAHVDINELFKTLHSRANGLT